MAQGIKKLWEQKQVWIIMILSQVLLNLIGQLLPEAVQVVLRFFSGCVLMALSGYAVYTQRKNMLAFMLNVLLLYFNYSLVSAVCWNFGALSSIFDGYTGGEFLATLNIELLFYGTYAILLKNDGEKEKRVFLTRRKPSYPVVILCALYVLVAPLLFYRTEAFGQRGYSLPLYEYSLVVMVVGLRFTGRDKKAVAYLLAASSWMILHGLLHGERILSLQMMLVWGAYLLLHVLSLKIIIPSCIAGVVLFTFFGIYRGISTVGENSLSHVLGTLFAGGMANDTSYYAYWAGMSIYRFSQTVTIWERLWYFVKYILYIPFGSLIPNVHLPVLASQVNHNLGGGWLAFYAHFWLGIPGVIAVGGVLAWLINKLTSLQKNRHFLNYLALYVVACSPRWYLYAPANITRGILIYAAFYGLCMLGRRHLPPILQWTKQKAQQWWLSRK